MSQSSCTPPGVPWHPVIDWQAEGLLDGLEEDDARAGRRALLDELHAAGVPLDELRRAVAEDRLVLLPVERLLTDDRRYSAREIAEETGIGLDFFQAHRRALGLATPDPDEKAYGSADFEAARLGCQYRAAGFPDDEALEVTRVLGQGMARYAEATRELVAQTFIEAGADERTLAHRYAEIAEQLLPLAAPFIGHVFALHMRQILRQDAITRDQMIAGRVIEPQRTAVAFADIVGFTALGESVPVEELGGVAGRLSRLAGELVEPPVRIVKLIGDAVMLVSPAPAALVGTALALVEATAGEEGLPALRVGVDFGPAVNRWGDWFGTTVNVASRLTTRARPGSVLVTEAVRAATPADAYAWSDAGEKKLKGLSAPVTAYRVRRPPASR
jgi:adenylate cyclase